MSKSRRVLFSDKQEIQRRSDDAAEKIAAEHRRVSRRLIAKISRATGIPSRTLERRFNGKGESLKGAKLELLLKTLFALEEDPAEFFSRALGSPDDRVAEAGAEDEGEVPATEDAELARILDPVIALQTARAGYLPEGPHLEDVRSLTSGVVPIPLGQQHADCLDSATRKIDNLREIDRFKALATAKARISKVLPAPNAEEEFIFRNPEKLSKYVARLGALASIHESFGRYHLAARTLELALSMMSTHDTALAADLYRRSAYVLLGLERPKLGLPLLEFSYIQMGISGNVKEATLALYAIAAFKTHLGDHKRALTILESCRHLPASVSTKIAISTLFAGLSIDAGDSARAKATLDALLKLDLAPRQEAYVQWRQAVCLGATETVSDASIVEAFRCALTNVRKHLQPSFS